MFVTVGIPFVAVLPDVAMDAWIHSSLILEFSAGPGSSEIRLAPEPGESQGTLSYGTVVLYLLLTWCYFLQAKNTVYH